MWNIKQMEGIRKDNTIYYQQKQHHRQQLRQHIQPQTIDLLEINHDPSTVSRKACQSLYQDQLERELAARSTLKHHITNSQLFAQEEKISKQRGYSISKEVGNFRDYEQEKDSKIKQHIINNYDGGSSFFRASQQHQYLRQKQLKQMGSTLKAQINSKMQVMDGYRNMKDKEAEAREKQTIKLKLLSEQEREQKKRMKENCREDYMRQMEGQKMRKANHNTFQYNHQTRHNPITNPISYHIDNPYILKQIQDNKLLHRLPNQS